MNAVARTYQVDSEDPRVAHHSGTDAAEIDRAPVPRGNNRLRQMGRVVLATAVLVAGVTAANLIRDRVTSESPADYRARVAETVANSDGVKVTVESGQTATEIAAQVVDADGSPVEDRGSVVDYIHAQGDPASGLREGQSVELPEGTMMDPVQPNQPQR